MEVEHFEGIVEIDETYFLYSQKGQRGITERKPRKSGGKSRHRGISHEQVFVLVARDRTKATVLVTDAWRAYKTYAKEKGIEHYRIKSDGGKHFFKGSYHTSKMSMVSILV